MRALVYGMLLAGLGCSIELPTATVSGIVPDRGWTGEVTPVRIEGEHLYPQITLQSGNNDITQDGDFDAWLVGPYPEDEVRRLGDVGRLSPRALEAYVPGGLRPGTYDLRLRSPAGEEIRSDVVFDVTATRADHLLLASNDWVHEVGAAATIELSLKGPEGSPVAEPLAFRVEALAEDASWAGVFSSKNPSHSASDGVLEGTLDELGTATFDLRVSEPSLVTLQAFPLDTDSRVLGDVIKMSWIASAETMVDVALLQDGASITAGESFRVQLTPRNVLGEVVEELRDVTVRNACADWQQEVRLEGVTTLDVTLNTATSTDRCSLAQDSLRVSGEAQGESDGFVVGAGPTSSFQVMVAEDVLRAGTAVRALVRSVDAWSNPSAWPGSPTLEDSQGGLVGGSCDVPIDSSAFCEGTGTRAGDSVVLIVRWDDIEGMSTPYRVIADFHVGELEIVMDDAVVTAGEAFPLKVYARDDWGNLIPPNDPELAWSDWEFTKGSEQAMCARGLDTGDGALSFECRVYEATSTATVAVSAGDVVVESAPFSVRSGPLDNVVVSVDATEVQAGEPLVVTGRAVDAWGNPYLRDVSTLVTMDAGLGIWTGPSLAVGLGVTSQAEGSFQRAGVHQLTLRHEGGVIGNSESIVVSAAAPSSLRVALDEPWAWVGEPVVVSVEAVDPFGNRVDIDSSEDGRVVSESAAFEPAGFRLVNGLGLAEVQWDVAVWGDVLEVESDDLLGESEPVLVVADCAGHTPLDVAVTMDGALLERVCATDDSDSATVEVSVDTIEPSVAVVRRLVSVDGGEAQTTFGTTLDVRFVGLGEHLLRYLLVDTAGCGQEGTSVVWLGPDDGSVVGRIPVVVEAGTLTAGGDEVLQVDVGPAKDCHNAPAAGGSVFGRVTRGELLDVEATGHGLRVALGDEGTGTMQWSASTVRSGGDAYAVVWESAGVARGQAYREIEGDILPPQVWLQDPTGRWTGTTDRVTLTFSESMRTDTFNFEDLFVSGADVASFEWSVDESSVSIVLADPLSVTTSTHDVVVAAGITDRAGNPLDGEWSDEAGTEYRGLFGDVGGSGGGNVCRFAGDGVTEFRPDGDPGIGPEADVVSVASEADLEPAWWVLSVRREGDVALLRRDRYPASSASWSADWDGRDAAGQVVPNGAYVLRVQAIDAVGNVGAPCELNVSVDNHQAVR